MKKMVNGVISDCTPEEQAAIEATQTAVTAEWEDLLAAEQQKENDKAAGNQKLLDLGLTQAEATALTGYIPPAE